MTEPTPAGERRRVDLTRLPAWARLLTALATVAIVGGIALAVGDRSGHPTIPISAIAAGLVAFAFVAWHAQRR